MKKIKNYLKLTKLGFTLIELLAVIIILAIIALIATPIILDVIEDSRDSASMSQAEILYSGAKTLYTSGMLSSGLSEKFNGNDELYGLLETTNEKPEYGTLKIDSNGKIMFATYIDGKCYSSVEGESVLKVEEMKNHLDCVPKIKGEYAKDYILKSEGLENILSKETPNFSNGASSDEGIYMAMDTYGESYYFRGTVADNWVKFDDFYWRIIRINGDDSIRLLYSGITVPTESDSVFKSGVDTTIGVSKYNNDGSDYSKIGYMYTTGEFYGNEVSSTVKLLLDKWYEDNLSDSASYIADTIYCGDRELRDSPDHGFYYSTKVNYRSSIVTNLSPILECNVEADRYTVNSVEGNGNLDYPIGLYTYDEVIMAGGHDEHFSGNYIYNGLVNLTMSGLGFGWGTSYVLVTPMENHTFVSKDYYVRPVISLKNDVELSGVGTYNDPYVVIEKN